MGVVNEVIEIKVVNLAQNGEDFPPFFLVIPAVVERDREVIVLSITRLSGTNMIHLPVRLASTRLVDSI